MDRQIIFDKIRQSRKSHLLTNCYSTAPIGQEIKSWINGENLVFAYEDHGIQRLVYFASDWNALDGLLMDIDKGTYCLEFLTRNPNEYFPSESYTVAKMKRVANPDCSNVFQNERVMLFEDETIGGIANIDDAHEINGILWETFNTEVSHLLSDDEVRLAIERREFSIHKDKSGRIDSILQVIIQPRKFYINQVINRGEKKTIHAMLINRLKEYHSSGGKYIYSWVAEDNIASIRWHEKYGMIHDGMWNMIYRLER